MTGWLFGSEIDIRREYSPHFAQQYHQPFEQFSPQYQMDYSYAPSVFIDSPGATGAVITTKKEAHSTPTISSESASERSMDTTKGSDLVMLLAAAAAATIGGAILVSAISKKKEIKKKK